MRRRENNNTIMQYTMSFMVVVTDKNKHIATPRYKEASDRVDSSLTAEAHDENVGCFEPKSLHAIIIILFQSVKEASEGIGFMSQLPKKLH